MKKYLIVLTLICMAFKGLGQIEKYKALYMYKFVQAMEWPASKVGDDFVIAVLNEPSVLSNLKTLTSGRQIKGKNIQAIKYTLGNSLEGVNMLFVANSKKNVFESVLKESIKSSTVLVCETPGLGSKGAFFNFIMQQGKLKFEINESSFTSANVKLAGNISSLGIKVD